MKMKFILIVLFYCAVSGSELLESFEDISKDDSGLRGIDSYGESLEDVEAYPIELDDIDGIYGDFDGRYRNWHGRLKKYFRKRDVNRCAPTAKNSPRNYIITEEHLKKIRSEKMYWYFDQCGDNGNGDYLTDVKSSISQIHKDFNFELPFYGHRYNYTRVSINGYLEFTDPPADYTYPLKFPMKGWPRVNDPAFIGIFFSKCRIGSLRPNDIDQQKPGVYFRVEENLPSRKDQFGVELRERIKYDIREAVVSADAFIPKHAVIVTWKNVSFTGGIDNSLYKTNTFQLVLATDEIVTFAIFNYADIQWTSHTEAGGDTVQGEGGVAAFVGFNAGTGSQSFEYSPFSQSPFIRDLLVRGGANGFPGRHIFKIDEEIVSYNKEINKTF